MDSTRNDSERSVELLRMAQAVDDQARDDLLARYLPRLQRWTSRRLPSGVRTMLETGDIVQEALIGALRHLIRSRFGPRRLSLYPKRAITNRSSTCTPGGARA